MATGADFERAKKVNRSVLILVTVIDMSLFLGCISVYLQGNIGVGFMLTVDLSVIFSMIACYTVYFISLKQSSVKTKPNIREPNKDVTTTASELENMLFEAKQMFSEMLTLAEQSVEAVRDGQESMGSLSQHAQKSNEANEQVASSVTSLISKAKTVEEITEQIFAISRQAYMLALNESIENGKTGAAGKGFAVVVRDLADEARALTEGIQNIVKELQANADTAKQTADNVITTVNMGHELISNANEQFENIGNSVGGLHTNIQTICRKVEEVKTFCQGTMNDNDGELYDEKNMGIF